MQEIGWGCGHGKPAWEYGESARKCKKMWDQGVDVASENGNLSIVVELPQNSDENNKFKEQIKVRIIENEYICKHLVSQI